MTRFDAIAIGTGQAGPSLAGRLAAAGMTVAVIERNLVGGTCVNTGCTPTKTLVASAQVAHAPRRGPRCRGGGRGAGGHGEGQSPRGRRGRQPAVVGSHVLLALGRRPNTDDLGLDKAGIATDARGYVTVDDSLSTSVPGVWALGDCKWPVRSRRGTRGAS